ncbi:hypothetical protein E2562_011592 [Oryza meyeriana var. granulata]|uniref:Uncharacterized protein n=1 Tax=Oryza meyeriana var. granulata TaxID=110450 RepID=A0A6G1DX25_9ORYZ|nr:hypothetical protein E2562_011592 [Oryza meyeriana var. granulata]
MGNGKTTRAPPLYVALRAASVATCIAPGDDDEPCLLRGLGQDVLSGARPAWWGPYVPWCLRRRSLPSTLMNGPAWRADDEAARVTRDDQVTPKAEGSPEPRPVPLY